MGTTTATPKAKTLPRSPSVTDAISDLAGMGFVQTAAACASALTHTQGSRTEAVSDTVFVLADSMYTASEVKRLRKIAKACIRDNVNVREAKSLLRAVQTTPATEK